ncbi:hypothetical protein FFLO_05954 [Filobasidium floriforme]|uniref:Uncharacterized protein n=1 Tax=Filobasidium floriforme TaxID=5210 RepID=A0A8K0JH88_9TREE|nr:hypothetical protein FFLO_05954 [Filobasidium floriforme]
MELLAILASWQRRPDRNWVFPHSSIPPLLLISTPLRTSGTCSKPRYLNYPPGPPTWTCFGSRYRPAGRI